MPNDLLWPSDNQNEPNFLRNLGMVLSMISGFMQGQPIQTIQAFQNIGLTDERTRALRQQQLLALQQAKMQREAANLFQEAPPNLTVEPASTEGPGFARPPLASPPAPNMRPPYDMQRALMLATQVPELREILTGPATREWMQQQGRLPTGAEQTLKTLQEMQSGLQGKTGGLLTDITVKGAEPTVGLRTPPTLEAGQAAAIGEIGGTPQQRLANITEAQRTPISEHQLQDELNRKFMRFQDVDKMLIGETAGDPLRAEIARQFGPAQGLDKLRLKIERHRLAADIQAIENRRAEMARRQGFPNEQPRRLFSSPVYGAKDLTREATKEYLANIKTPEAPNGIQYDPKTGVATPPLTPEQIRDVERFLRDEFGQFE